jgi:hypothetical protein
MRRVAMVLFGLSAVLLVAVVALVSGSQSSRPVRPVPVQRALTSDDSRLVDMTMAACKERLFGSVSDSANAVHVSFSTTSPQTGELCAQDMVIVLNAPLGDRPLIDDATGTAVSVEKVPADQLQRPLTRRTRP